MSHEAFLARIIAQPADDTARLVYADWLEENGGPADAARAEFIRVQCALARLSDDDPRRPDLEDREHELLAANATGSLGDWNAGFERGFRAEILTEATDLVERGDDLFAGNPITRLVLTAEDAYYPGRVEEFAARPWLSRLESVRLESWFTHVGGAEPLFTSPHLTGLTELDASFAEDAGAFPEILDRCPSRDRLRSVGVPDADDPGPLAEVLERTAVEELEVSGVSVTDAVLTGLLRAPFAGRLTRLRTVHGTFTPEGWRAFESPALTGSLRRLDITDSALAGVGIGRLLALPGLANLTELTLNGAALPPGGDLAAGVARSPFWRKAESFTATGVFMPGAAFSLLCRPDGPTDLKQLDVSNTRLGADGVRFLCSAPFADSLTELQLRANGIGDEGLAAIADSGRFARLRTLDLRSNAPQQLLGGEPLITDAGVIRLASSPALARLRSLDLSLSRLTARGVEAIINGPWRLARLFLDNCGLTADAVRVLAASPRLARLESLGLGHSPQLAGDALRPLAESPYLSPRCSVFCYASGVGEATRTAFLARIGNRFSG
jgi:uncharacterized protein (TIGR02996 family)